MTARHVHVISPDGPVQGLLVEWQQREGQWWALVATVTTDGHLDVQWRHESVVRAVPSD